MESYFEKSKLIKEEKWKKHIDLLRKKTRHSTKKNTKAQLKNILINSIKKRIPKKSFGIFFSGGIDSTTIALICKQLGAKFTCYCVGYKTKDNLMPRDLIFARKVAKSLGLNLVAKEFDLKQAEKIIKKTVKLLPKPHKINNTYNLDIDYMVKVEVGSVLIAAKSIAKESFFFTGLGSEEIFAGYQRHEQAKDKEKECWRGLKAMWKRDLERDVTIANKLKIKLATPFLDDNLIQTAMGIEVKKKINKKHKKIILRQIAEELGLKKEFAWRKKIAAQYGSKFNRALKKLAIDNKLKSRRDYLRSLLG